MSFFLKAFSIEAFDQISTSIPNFLLNSTKICCSFCESSFASCSVRSKSIRTPRHRISISNGIRAHSKSKIFCSPSVSILFLNIFHNFRVITASCSAYGPTYFAGSAHIPLFLSTPHAFEALSKRVSSFDSAKKSCPRLFKEYDHLFSSNNGAANIVSRISHFSSIS